LEDVKTQVAFGRAFRDRTHTPKSWDGCARELEAAGWQVQIQQSQAMGHPIQNLVAYRTLEPPQILLGAHYDSRFMGRPRSQPGETASAGAGADDGASGVAILLGLAHTLAQKIPYPSGCLLRCGRQRRHSGAGELLFGIKGLRSHMTEKPKEMILVDMVGGDIPKPAHPKATQRPR